MRCNEAVLFTLFHDEINLDEAKGGQQGTEYIISVAIFAFVSDFVNIKHCIRHDPNV